MSISSHLRNKLVLQYLVLVWKNYFWNVQSTFIFVLNNTYSRRIDGITIGSFLDSNLTGFFLTKLENWPLQEFIDKLEFYRCYIGNTFIIVDHNIGKENFLEQFNNTRSGIRFIYGEELDNKLHFLDVFARQEKKTFLSIKLRIKMVFQESQYTHFSSFAPIYYKQNLVRCHAVRARKICLCLSTWVVCNADWK